MNLQPRHYPGIDQNQALNSEAPSLLIRALAGTGKTTTLAIKAADLIHTKGARNVLMLAYSEAGIKAIQERLTRFTAVRLEDLHLLTLEQLCAQMLTEQGDPVPILSSDLEKNLLIAQAQGALQTNLLGDLIHKAFSGSGKDLVMAALRGHVSDEERAEIQRFLEENSHD